MDLIIKTIVDDDGTDRFFKFYLTEDLKFESSTVLKQLNSAYAYDDADVEVDNDLDENGWNIYCFEGNETLTVLGGVSKDLDIALSHLLKYCIVGFDDKDAKHLKEMNYEGKDNHEILTNYLNNLIDDIRYSASKKIKGKEEITKSFS